MVAHDLLTLDNIRRFTLNLNYAEGRRGVGDEKEETALQMCYSARAPTKKKRADL